MLQYQSRSPGTAFQVYSPPPYTVLYKDSMQYMCQYVIIACGSQGCCDNWNVQISEGILSECEADLIRNNCLLGIRMRMIPRATQVSEIVHCCLVGAKRTISGLWRLCSTCFLWFLVLFLLSWLLRWTDLLVLFFVRVANRRLRSALVLDLTPPNTYIVKGQPRCPPCPPSPRNVSPNSILHQCPHEMHVSVTPDSWAWLQIDIPKYDRKLTFLSVTNTYVRMYIRTSRE